MRRTALGAAIGLTLPLLAIAPAGAQSAPLAGETCDGVAATLVVPPPKVYPPAPFVGTPGDDVIVGTRYRDVIDGGGGNDIICGLGDTDVIVGGAGNDRLFGGLDAAYYAGFGDGIYRGDLIEPGPGDDYVDLGADRQAKGLAPGDLGHWDQVSYRHAAGPVTVTLSSGKNAGVATGEGTDTIAPISYAAGIDGSDFADRLTGSSTIDWITAGGGDDIVEGGDGDDVIEADLLSDADQPRTPTAGDDTVRGGAGDDEIRGGHGRDLLHGDDGSDALWVTDGTDARAYGDGGDDHLGNLEAPAGHVTFLGGAGRDEVSAHLLTASDSVVVQGGTGRDHLDVALSRAVAPARSRVVIKAPAGTVQTRAGTLLRFSGFTQYSVDAGFSRIKLTWHGSKRAETFRAFFLRGPVRAFGHGGNDRITTSTGNDLLDGGPGRDILNGHAGRDRCRGGETLISCEIRR